jgi:putative transposase
VARVLIFFTMSAIRPTRLKRLPAEFYVGEAWVHWVLAIQDRGTGWLDARLLYRFREVLTHAAFRYQFACPIFCLMPDHMHMLWMGLASETNQLLAMQRFRLDMNESLRKIGFSFQRQGYDHVLKELELERNAIEVTAEYIARNPERRGLVPIDRFAEYAYSGCLLPGACQLRLYRGTSWDEIWRTISFLRRTECYRKPDAKHP